MYTRSRKLPMANEQKPHVRPTRNGTTFATAFLLQGIGVLVGSTSDATSGALSELKGPATGHIRLAGRDSK